MRVVIIDDADKARSALKSDIKQFCPDLIIAGEGTGVENGIEVIKRERPDLIFLDIRMNDGTGFDLIEKLKAGQLSATPAVIFTTAYNEYAIKAFKFSAIDYLLKPIDPEDLIQAVDKVRKQKSSIFPVNLDSLISNLKTNYSSTSKRIALSSQEKIHIVPVSEIIRCESHSNYTLFHLESKKQILVTKTLKEYEDLLVEFGFLRVHHSHLINLEHLKEFIKAESYVLMSDQSQVPVSVRKKDTLLKHLGL